jgi:hypothetical protein
VEFVTFEEANTLLERARDQLQAFQRIASTEAGAIGIDNVDLPNALLMGDAAAMVGIPLKSLKAERTSMMNVLRNLRVEDFYLKPEVGSLMLYCCNYCILYAPDMDLILTGHLQYDCQPRKESGLVGEGR